MKNRIMNLLQQKNMYVKQRDAVTNNMFNIDKTRFSLENVKEAQSYAKVMGGVKKELAKELKSVDIDKIQDLQDDTQDLLELENEIQDVLGTTFGTDVIDESTMMDELNALDDYELQTEETPAFLMDIPASTQPVTSKGEEIHSNDTEKLTL
uniref:Charged multivesicular body protein 5 n=1 Tax=Lygus hesperus TaxID=30085 RepID=A0A0A9WN62_LYGHE